MAEPSFVGRSLDEGTRGRLAALGFLAAAAIVAMRTASELNVPDHPALAHYGLTDFRDAIYYPVVSWLQGVNPYDPVAYAKAYPVTSTFALYAPHTLLLHLPFGLLPLQVAEWVYLLIAVALMPILAVLILRATESDVTPGRVFGIAALLICSRPGESTLFLGQYTATVCLGVYLAIIFARERPWLAGIGVAIAVIKPTFGLPLIGLMFARRDWRALAIGIGIAGLLALIPVVILTMSMGGAAEWLDVLQRNREVFESSVPFRVTSSVTRIDLPFLMGRVLGTRSDAVTLIMGAVAALGVARFSIVGDVTARRLSDGLICLTIVGSMYHQGYDGLLLALPFAVLLNAPTTLPRLPRWLVGLLSLLLAVPLLNYFSTFAAVQGLGLAGRERTIATSLNAVVIFVAWAIYVGLAIRGGPARPDSGRS